VITTAKRAITATETGDHDGLKPAPATQRPSMRQVHEGGDKLFVHYSGKKPRIVDPGTGEVTEVELFVAVLGASNFTYAEATRT
jgi:transposase